MADQTIIASEDTYLDESSATTRRETIDNVQVWASAAGQDRNPVWQFDCSSLSGMSWDSVKLKVTWKASRVGGVSSAMFLSYVLQTDMTIGDCSWTNKVQDAGPTPWPDADAGAEGATNNDHTTRVGWDLSADIVADTTIVSADITDIVQKAVDENSGILNLILYGSGTQASVARLKSLETAGVSDADKPQLFFSGVQAASSSSSGGSSAPNDPSGSVAVSTKSSRPPVSEPGRMTTASVFHNGVEPMTILALITKSEYGRDA